MRGTIRTRLYAGFGILVVLTITVATTLVTNNIKAAAFDAALVSENEVFLIESIQVQLLEARRREGDFFLRYTTEGYETAFNTHVLGNQEHIRNIRDLLDELRTIETERSELDNLNKIEEATLAYETLLIDVVSQIGERGSIAEERGLAATLFQNVESAASAMAATGNAAIEAEARHTLEEILEYLLSPSQDAIDAVFRHTTALEAAIESSDLTAREKNDLLALVENSTVALNELIALDMEIAEKTDEFQLVAGSIAPLIEEFIKEEREEKGEALEKLEAAERIAQTINIVSLALAVFIGGGLAVIIARTVTAPITHLTAVTAQIAAGDLGARAQVAGHDEFGQLAEAFNKMAAELQAIRASLEERVAARTKQLRTVAEIAHATASIQYPEELMAEAVERIRADFGLYYAGIFLIDKDRRFAVLQAGSGNAGKAMLAANHRLEVGGQSMVGQTVVTGQPRIALDVGLEAVRFENPHLPLTRTELALPLQVGENVLGALTIQSVEPQAFDEADIATFQGLADQLAVAINNARLFIEQQANMQQISQLHGQYVRSAWQGFAARRGGLLRLQLSGREAHAVTESAPQPSQASQNDALRIPIQIRGREIGWIRLDQPPEREWAESEVALATAIVEQAGLALENARLIDETRQLAHRERTIGEIGDKIRRTTDVETILSTTLTELGQVLGARRGTIRLGIEAQPTHGDKNV